jgi:two-component system LytT family response regulator
MYDPATPIRCLLIDDEIQATATLGMLLKNHPEIIIAGEIHDPELAVEAIVRNQPGLVFLDIQMPGKSGFDIARELSALPHPPQVIFVTAYDQFAIEAIRHTAFDFLLKPVNPEDLARALQRFQLHRQKPDIRIQLLKLIGQTHMPQKLRFNTTSGFMMIDPAEIVFVEADWNYTEIHLSAEQKEMMTINLGSLEKMLPTDSFHRVSRSVIINIRYLSKVNRKKRQALLIKNGESFTIQIPLLNIRKLENFLDDQPAR